MTRVAAIILALFLIACGAFGAEPDCVLTVQPVLTVTNPLDSPVFVLGWWVDPFDPVVLQPGESYSWLMMEQATAKLYRLPQAPPAPTTPAQRFDVDADGDIDLEDYKQFMECFNGPNQPPKCTQ